MGFNSAAINKLANYFNLLSCKFNNILTFRLALSMIQPFVILKTDKTEASGVDLEVRELLGESVASGLAMFGSLCPKFFSNRNSLRT